MGSQRVGYDQTISFQKTALKYENHYVSIGSKLEPSVTPGMVFQLIHTESWRLSRMVRASAARRLSQKVVNTPGPGGAPERLWPAPHQDQRGGYS